jgi:hypothetical protein
MFNFHGGTAISTISLSSAGVAGAYLLQHSGNIVIALLFLAISALSFFLAVTTLTRFFINIKKYRREFSGRVMRLEMPRAHIK